MNLRNGLQGRLRGRWRRCEITETREIKVQLPEAAEAPQARELLGGPVLPGAIKRAERELFELAQPPETGLGRGEVFESSSTTNGEAPHVRRSSQYSTHMTRSSRVAGVWFDVRRDRVLCDRLVAGA